MRLEDARPVVVAMAQASVWVAEAQLTRARILPARPAYLPPVGNSPPPATR